MKFLVDAMLGRLARFLRIFGYDTLYANDLEKYYGMNPISDKKLLEHALRENRILITRDYSFYKKARPISIYIKGEGVYNYLKQLKEKLNLEYEFTMDRARCVCNSPLERITNKESIKKEVEEATFNYHKIFYRCLNPACRKIFWMGTHIENILKEMKRAGLIS
ncbi:MAG: DUF5615 family PIN-like protein [Promethearchaeota archaeon]